MDWPLTSTRHKPDQRSPSSDRSECAALDAQRYPIYAAVKLQRSTAKSGRFDELALDIVVHFLHPSFRPTCLFRVAYFFSILVGRFSVRLAANKLSRFRHLSSHSS